MTEKEKETEQAVLDEITESAEIAAEEEEDAAREDGVSIEKENETDALASTKFKNPEELLKAYEELEKEFTRRSQKLAKLENAASPAPVPEPDWKQTVDKFFERTPAAKPFAKDIAGELIAHPELKAEVNPLDAALTRVLIQRYRTPEQLLSDGEFLNEYILTSDAVKKAVIADYVKGLREGRPPVVMASGGEPTVASGSKPRTLEEAGAMFRKNNK